MADTSGSVVGRFAPSPTGELHFGSLVAALGSWLHARSQGGRWLVRIEDLDPPREVAGSAQRILQDLARLGLQADAEPLFQSSRTAAHAAALQQLLDQGLAYPCACSRASLAEGGRYPGTCRNGIQGQAPARSVRLRVPAQPVCFTDALRGEICEDLTRTCGDFVIWRADGLPAYQLAVVVDDAFQGITEVVRGADLLDSTPRQVAVQRALDLPTPDYLHLPVALGTDGHKLSKRDAADPLAEARPLTVLSLALEFLGQQPPVFDNHPALLDWAVAHWRAERIPRVDGLAGPDRSSYTSANPKNGRP